MTPHPNKDKALGAAFIGIFLVVAGGLAYAGFHYYRNYQQQVRLSAERQLIAVAELRASELVQWRTERLGDAKILYQNPAFSALAEQLINHPTNADAREQLETWLENYQTYNQYDQIYLLDSHGVERLVIPAAPESITAELARQLPELLAARQVTFLDFHRHANDHRIHLAVLVPVLAGPDTNQPIGLLVLHIDPSTYLYPLIQGWPTHSQTAEMLLVRREGDDVVALNELKYKNDAAMSLRRPLTQVDLPAVKAVLGAEGVVEGVDYRGIPVIAVVHPVPNSPWFLVAKMDTAEIYASLQPRYWQTVGFFGALIVAVGAAMLAVWRQQRLRFYRERLQIEQERAWLQHVIAQSLNEIYIFDPHTLRFIFANDGACRNIGYLLAELTQLTPLEIIPTFTPATFRQLLQPLLNGERELLVYETTHRRRDGSDYPVEVQLQCVTTSGDGPALLLIANDITGRKQAEEQLRETAQRLELATTSARIGIWDWDLASNTLIWDNQMCQLYQVQLEEFEGVYQAWEKRLHPDDWATTTAAVQAALAGEKEYHIQFRIVWADGQTRFIEGHGLVQRAADGVPQRMTGVNWDITDRIHLTKNNEQLQAQFYQAQKMESIGRLAGGIAHDFNNLLVPIIGYADLGMSIIPETNRLHNNLEQIKKAGERAAKLTRQILAFSRQQVLEMELLDLNELITDFEKMLRRLIGEDISLHTQLTTPLHYVRADKSQIEQILLNLVVNARDAMPNGGQLTVITANVSLDEAYAVKHPEMQPGPYVQLTVSDTGYGMTVETQERIFEPFFTTKAENQGTGLGLATVFGIVKQHGGNIWVYSQLEKGTTFKIYLPAGEITPHAIETARPDNDTVRGIETILVIEDEPGVRELACYTLRIYGYHVLEADGPETGLAVAANYCQPIDLLLTDVILPGMNGQEVYRQLVRERVDLKVLYMSGYTNDVLSQRGTLNPGIELLQKPFAVQTLLKQVRTVLDCCPPIQPRNVNCQ